MQCSTHIKSLFTHEWSILGAVVPTDSVDAKPMPNDNSIYEVLSQVGTVWHGREGKAEYAGHDKGAGEETTHCGNWRSFQRGAGRKGANVQPAQSQDDTQDWSFKERAREVPLVSIAHYLFSEGL